MKNTILGKYSSGHVMHYMKLNKAVLYFFCAGGIGSEDVSNKQAWAMHATDAHPLPLRGRSGNAFHQSSLLEFS